MTSENKEEIVEEIMEQASEPVKIERQTPPETPGQVTVENTTNRPVERAGLLFMPRSPVLISKTDPKLPEIKACQALKIF